MHTSYISKYFYFNKTDLQHRQIEQVNHSLRDVPFLDQQKWRNDPRGWICFTSSPLCCLNCLNPNLRENCRLFEKKKKTCPTCQKHDKHDILMMGIAPKRDPIETFPCHASTEKDSAEPQQHGRSKFRHQSQP